MSGRVAFVAAIGCLLVASPAAFAQRYVSRAEGDVHRHEGLFMRFEGGAGYLKTSSTVSGSSASVSGPAGSFGFSIGSNVVEDLSLFGHLGISVVTNPDVSMGSSTTGTGDSSLNFVALGGGANYYFMPYNVYVSGTVLMTRLTTTLNGTSGSTNAGIGAKMAIGKEWWVSDHWGIGVAGEFSFGSNPDRGSGSPPTWTTFTPAVAFSASFN